jgi:hypothetical protein
MDPPIPPLPPINDNTVGSVNVAVESFDLDSSASAIAASVADNFFRSAFSESGGSQDRFLGEESPDDNGTNTDESPGASTSAPYQVGVLLDDVAAENEVLALGVSFPTEQPFFENRYHNQKENQNEEGYDSEGNLPHFADVKEDDMEAYDEEAPIIFPTAVPTPAPAELGRARSEGVEG